MRQATGILIALFGLAIITVLILRVWGIIVFGWEDMLRSTATLLLLGGAVVLLVLVRYIFFPPSKSEN